MPHLNLDVLAKSPFIGHLTDSVRDCVLSKARAVQFKRGTTIGLQGEPAMSIKLVQSGWVKLYRVMPDGQETILSTLTAGQSFDEIAALQQRDSPFSAEAISDCTVVYFDISQVCACADNLQEISNAVISAAAGQYEQMLGEIEQLKVKTGTQRLTEFLIDLSVSTRGAEEITLPFEKTILAGKLGIKPESLSRAFGRLKAHGVKCTQKHVLIQDVEALRMLSDRVDEAA